MSILLPSLPGPTDGTVPELVDAGGVLKGTIGGSDQKLNRLGDRYRLAVTLPPMPYEPTGRAYISRLQRGMSEGVIIAFPQPGMTIASAPSAAVNGSGGGGKTLPVKGLPSGYDFLEGQFVSVVHDGRRYLHCVDVPTSAAGDGTVTLTVTPMLRFQPANNDVIEVSPRIEGFLTGGSVPWSPTAAANVGLTFTITEAR